MTLADFYNLLAGLDRKFRYRIASAAYRYGDLRLRGLTRAQARNAVLGVPEFDIALRAMGVRDDFRSIAD